MFRAGLAEDADSAVLAGGDDDLEELLGYVAAEANHEEGPSSPGSSSNEAFQTLNEIGDQS